MHRDHYSLEYKAANKNGIGTLLKENVDFMRFLAEHLRLEMQKKDMLVLAVLKETKNKQRRQYARDSDVSKQHCQLHSVY